jgi:hypothetical protein
MARLGRVVPCTYNTGVLPTPLSPYALYVQRHREQVLFRTTDQSWHGLPDAIASPPGVNRNRYLLLCAFVRVVNSSGFT